MLKLSSAALFSIAITMAACSQDVHDSDVTGDSYEVTALLTCNEVASADSETPSTIFCEQPETGMTPEMVEPYISALVTCGVNWQAMQDRRLNEYVFSDIVSTYFTNDPNVNAVLIPIAPLMIFNLPVKNFRSGFGMLPGFMVTFDIDHANIRNTLDQMGFQFDQCTEQSCELNLTGTETIILHDQLFGCAYPFQR